MMSDCKSAISDGTGDTKLLDLVNCCASFNLMSFLVARHLGWIVRPNTTPVVVKLANGTVVYS